MIASEKAVRGPETVQVSREIRELADLAAKLRRADLRGGRKLPLKNYFKRVLEEAHLEATTERLRAMGSVLGRRGGARTAELRRMGVVTPKQRHPAKGRRRFSELLFPRVHHI